MMCVTSLIYVFVGDGQPYDRKLYHTIFRLKSLTGLLKEFNFIMHSSSEGQYYLVIWCDSVEFSYHSHPVCLLLTQFWSDRWEGNVKCVACSRRVYRVSFDFSNSYKEMHDASGQLTTWPGHRSIVQWDAIASCYIKVFVFEGRTLWMWSFSWSYMFPLFLDTFVYQPQIHYIMCDLY